MIFAGLGRGELGRAADQDELLDPVEVRQPGDEVVRVLLPLDHAAALVLLELERPGADLGLGRVQVAVLGQDVLGRDPAPRRGDRREERRAPRT